MKTRARVVVALDGQPGSSKALRWACDYAAATGADVTALNVWQPGSAGSESRRVDAVRALHEQIARFTTSFDPPVRQRVIEGDIVGVLVEESASADLIVIGSRRRGGLSSNVLGRVSQEIAGKSQCPVVVVRQRD